MEKVKWTFDTRLELFIFNWIMKPQDEEMSRFSTVCWKMLRNADSLHSLMGSSLQSEQSLSWLHTLLSSMHSPLRHLNLSGPLHADAARRRVAVFSILSATLQILSYTYQPLRKGAKWDHKNSFVQSQSSHFKVSKPTVFDIQKITF